MTDIMANSEIPTLGQVAFEAYCAAVGGQTFDGKPIPGWDELHGDRLKVQGGWEAAAQAVREHMRMIDALDRTAHLAARQGLGRVHPPSRWRPVSDYTGPEGRIEVLPEPEFSAPIGHGEPPTGEHIPVVAGPDTEARCRCPEGCCGHRG